jgi:tRNA threonylcarbamoyladenosine biosynthesis protein TsaB
MNILAIDTATSACSLALQCGTKRFSRHVLAPRQQSKLLLGLLNELLVEADININAVDLFCVGVGPGSFIGSRLAVATIKGLAFANSKPVLPVSTLKTLAQTAYRRHSIRQVAACWDARMQQLYLGCYHLDANACMVADKVDCLVYPADLFGLIGARTVVGLPDSIAMLSPVSGAEPGSVGRDVLQLYPEAYDMLDFAVKSEPGSWLQAVDVAPCYLRKPVTD